MKKIMYVVWGFLAVYGVADAAQILRDPLKKVGKNFLPIVEGQKIFLTTVEEKQNKLQELSQEATRLRANAEKATAKTKEQTEDIKSQLDSIADGLKKDSSDEFVIKKQVILTDTYQSLKNIQQSYEEQVSLIEKNIALLQDYLNDSSFKEYKQSLNIAQRDIYSLEDLQALTQLILEKEKIIAQLQEQEKIIDSEMESRKRTLAAELDKNKKEERAAYNESLDLGAQQKTELARLEAQQYSDRNERDLLRLKEIEYKKGLVKTKLFIEMEQLKVLKDSLNRVKPAITVSEEDITLAQEQLTKKQQQAIANKEAYNKDLEQIDIALKNKEKELQETSKKYGIPLSIELDEWSKTPQDSVEGFKAFFEMGHLNDSVLFLQRQKDLLNALLTREDEIIRSEEMNLEIKNSFYKITTHKFSSEEETALERKKYEAPRSEVRATLAEFDGKKNTEQDRLLNQKKALSNIKETRKKLTQKKNSLFRGNPEDYALCLELLNSAEDKVQDQIDTIGKIQNIYTDIVSLLVSKAKQIEFIIAELELTTIWQRSKYAITWEGFQNIRPDLERFVTDVRSYVCSFNAGSFLIMAQDYLATPSRIVLVIIVSLIILAIIVSIRRITPVLAQGFIQLGSRYRGLRLGSFLLALFISFIGKHAASLVIWAFIILLLHVYELHNPYAYILMYLAAIPYLLYLSRRFITCAEQFNMQYNYVFVTQEFQRRLILVSATLLYATISILLLREAFLLGGYRESELPAILLAINFIIFQVALIFLIAKEQILKIIPTSTEMWRWVATQVDRFYYLILMVTIAIIIMSNPYVGFGKLVWYVLKRIIYTIILLRILLWLNQIFRRGLAYVFFSRGEEFVRERFSYGKTLYGIFAITLFFCFIVIFFIVSAKIWGWPESFAKINQGSDIISWLQTPLILEKTDNPISLFSLLKIVFFVVMGFFAAFIVDRFMLEKIFDVLLVDSGVQNTISSIARYIILFSTIILGFQSVGLGELVVYIIGALIVGIGWVIKDPIGDFIAYFIILVQRPVKIGDYIRMDDETFGVVRKITPRSVVVRRRNSTTIILPNTTVINKPLMNWNYVRGFVAFDDISVTVSYREDPAKVKEILLKVMEENPFVLKNPNPIVRLDQFGEIGFVFMARGFVSSNYTLDIWDIASDVRLSIVKELRKHGIQLAVPARIILGQDSTSSSREILSDKLDEKNKD